MIIDSVADKTGIDISKLAVPEVKTESLPTFDPASDITEKAWEGGLAELSDFRGKALPSGGRKDHHSQLLNYGRLARDLKFFFPENEAKFSFDEEILAVFKEALPAPGLFWNRPELSSIAKYLFPEKAWQFSEKSSSMVGEVMVGQVQSAREIGSWRHFLPMALEVKQFFDDGFNLSPLSDQEWVKFRQYLARMGWGTNFSTFADFTEQLAAVRLLFPERYADLNLNKETWQRARRMLKGTERTELWAEFFKAAYYMTILAAEEASITSDGKIKVVMPKQKQDLAEKIPNMPIKRAF